MDCNCGKLNLLPTSTNKNIIKSKYEMIEMNSAYTLIKNYFNNFPITNNIIEINIIDINSENFISAENIISPTNLPKFNTSVMDGYAVNSNFINLNEEINIVENIYANKNNSNVNVEYNFDLKSDCVYVTTGSQIPKKFNCVIPIEYAEQLGNNKIKFIEEAKEILKEFYYVRQIGCDIKENEILIEKGNCVRLTDLGILLSVGIEKIKIFRLPKIGIISTGDELIDYKTNLNVENLENKNESNFVIDTNRLLLQKLLKEQYPDIEICDLGIVNDDINKLRNIFESAIENKCDFLITSGGVSMGEKDLVKKLLELEGNIIFGRLSMKPGKPTTFGNYKNLTVIALPGNPVSCIVCFYLIVCYCIKTFQIPFEDFPNYFPFKIIKAKLLHNINLDLERPEYSRGVLYFNKDDNLFYVNSTGNQQSSRLRSFNNFNCLIKLPKGNFNLKKLNKFEDNVECLIIKFFDVIDKNLLDKLIKDFEINLQDNNNENNLENKSSINKIKKYTVGTITISDRAFQGEYETDKSTIALKSYFEKSELLNLVEHKIIPDEKEEIKKVLKEYVDKDYNLIVTSGGTGFSSRDVTPEATKEFIDREANSISTYITIESMKITKFACLSRNVVGIKNRSLIINLPGNPKAVKENMDIIKEILPHMLNQVIEVKDFH